MGISRRDLLQFIFSAAISGSVFSLFKLSKARALPRPPGAIIEEEFLKYCVRCYRCIDFCPVDALHPAAIFDGISNVGTPVLDVTKCIMCMECIRTCPTGAIRKIPKKEVDLGTAVIDSEKCLALLRKKRCKVCYERCPLKAVELKRRRFPIIIEEKCNGCGICLRQCPTKPKAITISYAGAKRFNPPDRRLTLRLEDRVGPYEFPQPDFKTWFVGRIRTLMEHYGVIRRKG